MKGNKNNKNKVIRGGKRERKRKMPRWQKINKNKKQGEENCIKEKRKTKIMKIKRVESRKTKNLKKDK